ncbi:MAG: recombinase family protein, partial [Ignavibacteriales bacterium]
TRARKEIDWMIIKDTFRKNRVVVITPSQEYNFEDEDQEFISDLFSRISTYEKKKILRRMLRGKRENAKGGKFLGGIAPFGYTWNENTKQYEIIEAEAEVIRLIFSLCLEGMSVKKIRDHLNSLGHGTPLKLRGCKSNGKAIGKWATSTITKVLTSSKYIGEFERWRQKLVDRNVRILRPEDEWIISEIPPIITKEVFELAQESLKSRKVLSTRNSKMNYLPGGCFIARHAVAK